MKKILSILSILLFLLLSHTIFAHQIKLINKANFTIYCNVKARTSMQETPEIVFSGRINQDSEQDIDFPEEKIFTLRAWNNENGWMVEDKASSIQALKMDAQEIKAISQFVLTEDAIKEIKKEIKEDDITQPEKPIKAPVKKAPSPKKAIKKTALKKPALKKPVTKKAALKKVVVKKPATKKAAIKKPAVKPVVPITPVILDLIIFIDHKEELNYPSALFYVSNKALQQQAAPCLIFGKHLLANSINSLDLTKWIIFEFTYETLGGFLLIPRKYAQQWLKKDISSLTEKAILFELGFSLPETFNSKTINNKNEIQQEAIDSLSREEFNRLVPEACSKVLTNFYKKCVYIIGHGDASENVLEGLIANLSVKGARKLFSILEQNKTLLVYVSTCFLGGENIASVQEILNSIVANIKPAETRKPDQKIKSLFEFSTQEPQNMIFISGATTQVSTEQVPSSFIKFFQAFKDYVNKEDSLKKLLAGRENLSQEEKSKKGAELQEIKKLQQEIGSLKSVRKYFATKITNRLSGGNISAIPQIRFPTTDAKSYSLAPAVIDELTIGKATLGHKIAHSTESISFDNQNILVINVPEITVPITLTKQVPLLISGIGLHRISFEEIDIQEQNCDLDHFMLKAIKGDFESSDKASFFAGYPYEDVFTIKKLVLTKESDFGAVISLTAPKILTDLVITRDGKDHYTATFRIQDKSYTYEYEEGHQLKRLEAIAEIDDVQTFKLAIQRIQSENPDLINKPMSSGKTLLIDAIGKGILEKVKILIEEAHADVNKQGKIITLSNPLNHAIISHKQNIVEYLIKDAHANVNKKDNTGWYPLHAAALSGNFDSVKSLVAAGAKTKVTDFLDRTPESIARSNGHTEIADFLCKQAE